MKQTAISVFICALCACSVAEEDGTGVRAAEPVSTTSDDTELIETPELTAKDEASAPKTAAAAPPKKTTYWGIKEGDAQTLMWEDLMPEGSEEDLIREYEEFYSMLEKRYAANSSSLADAEPYGAIAEGSEFDFMPQLGGFETVEDLNGEYVRIPGYVVPFDLTSKMRQREFLFVPYMGACIHTPPPPPNQIIFIRADPPVRVKDIWAPYWIEGTLSTEKTENNLGDTAYSMRMSSIEPYSDW